MTAVDPEFPSLKVRFDDEPAVVEEAATEDFSTHVVPREWRMDPRALSGAWWAFASAMFWLIFAALVALTVGTVDALIGMGLSVVVYGLINWVLSVYAARTGTTVNLFSMGLFGYVGGLLAPVLLAVTAIYFATLEGSVIAVAFKSYFGFWDMKIWYLIVVLYSVPLVIGSVRNFLDKFNRYLLPFYALGLVAVVIWTVVDHGYNNDWLAYHPIEVNIAGPGWVWAFTAFMGDWVLMMATWDFARFGRNTSQDERRNGWFTFGPFFYFFTIFVNGVIGIFVALTLPTDGPLSETSGVIGIVAMMGFWGLLFVWISQTRINTANFYLAATNLENALVRGLKIRIPRKIWVVVVGAVVYLIMLSDVFSFLLQALTYQAVLTVTWTSCVLSRIVWGRVRNIPAEDAEWRPGRVRLINWVGFAPWLLGTAVGSTMLAVGGTTNMAWTLALPTAFVVSFVAHTVSLETFGVASGPAERGGDPRLEVEDPWSARAECGKCGRSYVVWELDRNPDQGHDPICATDAQLDNAYYRSAAIEAYGPLPVRR